MQRLLPASLFAGLLFLAACAAPAPTNTVDVNPNSGPAYVPEDAPQFGPGDTCAETYVFVYEDNTRTNFSLGSSNYNNEDYCGAYPYLKWLVANDPLFTGEDPDDRNFLRLATTYEWFAAQVDSSDAATRKAYLDSALATRAAGRQAMNEAGIAYDSYLRDLREGFFYYSYGLQYDDPDTEVNEAEIKQFEAFNRAFEAQPDSLEDWYITQLFNQSAVVYEEKQERADYVRQLASAVDQDGLQTYYTSFVEYLETPEPDPAESGVFVDVVEGEAPSSDPLVERLYAEYQSGSLSGDDVLTLLAVATQAPGRLEAVGGNPDAVTSALVNRREVQDRIDNPSTLYSLAMRAFARGNTTEGNRLFDRAIANAGSNATRANFYAARASKGYGNKASLIRQCLQYNSTNSNCLFLEAGLKGDAARAAAGSSVEGRAAYWCMADIYRNVAAVSSGQIAAAARRAANQYERAGPSRDQYFFATSWRPGQTVTASLGAYGSCRTRVR